MSLLCGGAVCEKSRDHKIAVLSHNREKKKLLSTCPFYIIHVHKQLEPEMGSGNEIYSSNSVTYTRTCRDRVYIFPLEGYELGVGGGGGGGNLRVCPLPHLYDTLYMYVQAPYCRSLPECGPSSGDRDCSLGFRSGRRVRYGGGETGREGTGVVGRDAPGSRSLLYSLLPCDG